MATLNKPKKSSMELARILHHKFSNAVSVQPSPRLNIYIRPDESRYPSNEKEPLSLCIRSRNEVFGTIVGTVSIPYPYRILQANALETRILHITTRMPFKNSTVIDTKRYTIDLKELSSETIRSIISYILNSEDPRANYTWVKPLQDLLITRELKYKNKEKKRVYEKEAEDDYLIPSAHRKGVTLKSWTPSSFEDTIKPPSPPQPIGVSDYRNEEERRLFDLKIKFIGARENRRREMYAAEYLKYANRYGDRKLIAEGGQMLALVEEARKRKKEREKDNIGESLSKKPQKSISDINVNYVKTTHVPNVTVVDHQATLLDVESGPISNTGAASTKMNDIYVHEVNDYPWNKPILTSTSEKGLPPIRDHKDIPVKAKEIPEQAKAVAISVTKAALEQYLHGKTFWSDNTLDDDAWK